MLVEYTINVFSRSTALVRRFGPIPIRWWLLSLLQLLSLLFVLLLQLLRLLLVLLLHLLLCCFTGVLLRQPLMFLLLLLLEFLPFLFLLREYLFLLLLVLLVQLRVACAGGAGARRGRKVARMDRRAGSRSIVVGTRCRGLRTRSGARGSGRIVAWLTSVPIGRAIGRRSIRRPWRFRRHDGAVVPCSWFRSRCDRRLAHVHGSSLLRISSRRLRMLSLNRDRRNMSLPRRGLFLRCWTPADPAIAAVVTDMGLVVIDYGRVVHIVNDSFINIVHGAVVEKVVVIPTPAFVALSKITEAIIDPAVETNHRTPITLIKNKTLAAPTPITWSPQETDFRRQHPGAGHPIIIVKVISVGPVAGCPNVAVLWTDRLFIDRQRGRSERNDHADLCERRCRHAQYDEREQQCEQQCEQQRTNETDLHCDSSGRHPSFA